MRARWGCAAARQRGASFGFGHAPRAERPADGAWARATRAVGDLQQGDTGAGYVSPKEGDYTRAQRRGCARRPEMLVETFGGIGPALLEE